MTEQKISARPEQGIVVPYDQINPATLRTMIQEFVSRDGADWGDARGTLEDKVKQVLAQLNSGRVQVVFDLNSNSANLVART